MHTSEVLPSRWYAYIHTYIHVCGTHIHIHTYIHTYIHVLPCICVCSTHTYIHRIVVHTQREVLRTPHRITVDAEFDSLLHSSS